MFNVVVISILLILSLLSNTAKALIEEPNYNFTFDKFLVFTPLSKFEDVKKEYPAIKLINKKGAVELYEVSIIHQLYKFPVYIQTKDGIVIDYYARLPNYFIHDTFHQSLINRYGKQNKFTNRNNTSFYIWDNVNDTTITYSGACTITCFPIFVHVISNKDKTLQKESLIEKMKKNQL